MQFAQSNYTVSNLTVNLYPWISDIDLYILEQNEEIMDGMLLKFAQNKTLPSFFHIVLSYLKQTICQLCPLYVH